MTRRLNGICIRLSRIFGVLMIIMGMRSGKIILKLFWTICSDFWTEVPLCPNKADWKSLLLGERQSYHLSMLVCLKRSSLYFVCSTPLFIWGRLLKARSCWWNRVRSWWARFRASSPHWTRHYWWARFRSYWWDRIRARSEKVSYWDSCRSSSGAYHGAIFDSYILKITWCLRAVADLSTGDRFTGDWCLGMWVNFQWS